MLRSTNKRVCCSCWLASRFDCTADGRARAPGPPLRLLWNIEHFWGVWYVPFFDQIERELELQQTKEMLARLGKKVDNVEKMDKSGREVRLDTLYQTISSIWVQQSTNYEALESRVAPFGCRMLVKALQCPDIHPSSALAWLRCTLMLSCGVGPALRFSAPRSLKKQV